MKEGRKEGMNKWTNEPTKEQTNKQMNKLTTKWMKTYCIAPAAGLVSKPICTFWNAVCKILLLWFFKVTEHVLSWKEILFWTYCRDVVNEKRIKMMSAIPGIFNLWIMIQVKVAHIHFLRSLPTLLAENFGGKMICKSNHLTYNQSNADKSGTQQSSYSVGHLLGTVTTRWLDSDRVVTVVNCQKHGDYTVDQVVTMLMVVSKSDYTVTVQSLCRKWLMREEFCCVPDSSMVALFSMNFTNLLLWVQSC